MIPFCKPTLGKEEEDAVLRVLRSGWLAAGKETEAFEKEFAEFVGVKYAIFTNCGTSALKMSYKWFKETHKHKGLLGMYYPKNTFCATYSAAEEMGLFTSDFETTTFGLRKEHRDTYEFQPPNTDKRTACKVNMHYGGVKDETPCLIEDSAHRIEPNDPLIGKIRIYSFYVTKNMTTGSGGMLVTNDKEIYERCRTYWRDGLTTSTADRETGNVFYEVVSMAGGYDGNDVQAAIGRAQLKKLPEFNRRRQEIVSRYNTAFGADWKGLHLYPYEVGRNVKDFIKFQKRKGISCGYHYPQTGWTKVSLPLYPLMTDEEVGYVIKSVEEYEEAKLQQ